LGAASRFADRREAGRSLAKALSVAPGSGAVVYGIPRGGVVVAAAVAAALDAPLDTVVVRKLGHPSQEEAAIGAVAEQGVVMPQGLRDPDQGRLARLLEPAIERLHAAVDERVRLYRGDRVRASARDRTAIVVDDGLATGLTFAAALEVVRCDRPARLIGAVPVASAQGLELAAEHCDEMVALVTADPGAFFAVSLHYDRFGQVGDDEVRRLLGAVDS
jgi:predicted phosphoribosyltransferase